MIGAVAGLLAGSFLGTLVLRWPAGIGLGGRSRCDSCQAPLPARDLVPLFSFLWLGGRCRHCHAAIDRRHPMIELAAMLLGAIALAAVPGPWGLVSAGFLWALLALLLLDIAHYWLPDRLTWPLLLAGLALGPAPLPDRALGAAIAGGALLALALGYRALRGRDGLGLGDAKLAAAIGAWLSPPLLPLLLLLASAFGLVMMLVRIGRGVPVNAGTRLPFGACLAIAAVPLHLGLAAGAWS